MHLFDRPASLDLTNKNILITGGTGSFGSTMLQMILAHYPSIGSLTVFSRDEYKQLVLFNQVPEHLRAKVHFILGDIRDSEAVAAVFKKKIHIIIHAAALKHISFSESNPTEFIKTNIYGSKNIFDAANTFGVEKCLVVSSDKAAAASNTYGRTKAEMERLMHIAQSVNKCQFSAIRFGNFWGSRGSVVPQFLVQFAQKSEVQLFNETSTRFFITLEDAVRFSFKAIDAMVGGEIFIPKLPSIYIKHIAEAVAGKAIALISNRKGEKTHENLLAEPEIVQTLENDFCYILTNNDHDFQLFKKAHQASVLSSFALLKSDTNMFKLSLDEVKSLLAEYRKKHSLSLGLFHTIPMRNENTL